MRSKKISVFARIRDKTPLRKNQVVQDNLRDGNLQIWPSYTQTTATRKMRQVNALYCKYLEYQNFFNLVFVSKSVFSACSSRNISVHTQSESHSVLLLLASYLQQLSCKFATANLQLSWLSDLFWTTFDQPRSIAAHLYPSKKLMEVGWKTVGGNFRTSVLEIVDSQLNVSSKVSVTCKSETHISPFSSLPYSKALTKIALEYGRMDVDYVIWLEASTPSRKGPFYEGTFPSQPKNIPLLLQTDDLFATSSGILRGRRPWP